MGAAGHIGDHQAEGCIHFQARGFRFAGIVSDAEHRLNGFTLLQVGGEDGFVERRAPFRDQQTILHLDRPFREGRDVRSVARSLVVEDVVFVAMPDIVERADFA